MAQMFQENISAIIELVSLWCFAELFGFNMFGVEPSVVFFLLVIRLHYTSPKYEPLECDEEN